jgi:hypothetical protein
MEIMRCEQFNQFLEQEPDSALTRAAELHVGECPDCLLLWNDIQVIRELGRGIAAEDPEPPRRIWVALRAQLESEGVIRDPHPTSWFGGLLALSPRSALAGAFLLVLSLGVTVANYDGQDTDAIAVSQPSRAAIVPVSAGIGSALDGDVAQLMASLPDSDATLSASFRQNLGIVNNLIALCERSVREQPNDPVAREYLYGAYQQKSVLLATAMDRTSLEGR